ncbi:peptidase S8/S53 domain-containing protein [Infundibulicybe gibba]|nr:peptidase S8/S53 domain-containing protein [Infundibulicybe gibba]
MRLPWSLLLLLAQRSAFALTPAKRSYDTHNYYVLEHVPDVSAGASLAELALTLGVEVVEQAGELQNHWLVRIAKPLSHLGGRGEMIDPVLQRFEMLRVRAMSAPGSHVNRRSADAHHAQRLVDSVKYLSRQTLRQRIKRAPPPIRPGDESPSRAIASRLGIQDPLFPEQWHLINDQYPEHMMNATSVWDMGFTGKGVISSLVDDGLDYTSDDLAENFDADDSYDFNDHEKLPFPKLSDDHHGTRCAGQVAAGKNGACGVGIAYDSKVAGVRILSGAISDVDEAAALNYGFQNVSIYSCSWGPPDNGESMEGPGYLIKKAVVNGINNGRGGKGSIFVFASGNGAAHQDQCNFDGYTNSIYSVTVSAIDYKGLHPYYSEPCAANMIVAYSSGDGQHIVTTDKGKNECTKYHGGTSAAAPNAVGVFALALQARPDLTWRDVQHLCVETARIVNDDDPDWETIATGKRYSYKYGFGALDAYRYVKAAQDWKLVKPQAWFGTKTIQLGDGKMDENEHFSGGQFINVDGVKSTMSITKDMLEENNFEQLEHINIKVWIDHTRRGDVEVEIVSPKGIKSVLAAKRPGDAAASGYPGWMFMSVKHWGEDPVGDWTIKVSDQAIPAEHNGTFLGWNMIFWGSTIVPSKAKAYEVPVVDNILPPHVDPPTPSTSATNTKTHAKPTAHLPGENTKPAFSSGVVDAANPTGTSPPNVGSTPDEGWFSDMSNLVSNQKWFFAAMGAVVLFGIGVGIFFWRRRAAQRRLANYSNLSGGDINMSALSGHSTGGPRTKELYDAFGEVSDDDEDADEETALRGGHLQDRSSGGLDDDEPPSAGGSQTPLYRDIPDESEQRDLDQSSHEDRAASDGSWEHTS